MCDTMSHDETVPPTSLTPRQIRALTYLADSPTVSEAARQANVARATLYRWMEEPDFRQEVERLRGEAADMAKAELKGLMLKAVSVLSDSMHDTSSLVRLRAAQSTMYIGMKAIDVAQLEQRIDRIEDALAYEKAK
jgi:hypothetical protein